MLRTRIKGVDPMSLKTAPADLSGPPTKMIGRLAGALYLVVIVVGGYGHLTTAEIPISAITERAATWRVGAAAMLVMLTADVGLAVLLLRIFERANRSLALAAFAFRLVVVAVLAVALTVRLSAPMQLAEGAGAYVAASIEFSETAFDVAFVFFGFTCLSLGALILQARLVPLVFGPLFLLSGAAYLASSFARLLGERLSFAFDILMPAYAVELAFALWLTVFAVRTAPAHAAR